MPFERLEPRLGPIAPQQVPQFNVPPVVPIGDIIKHGADQVSQILDTFNPLNIEERKARIALATMQTYAAQQARAGNWDPFMKLHGHFQNMQSENIKNSLLLQKLKMGDITLKQLEDQQNSLDKAFGTSDSKTKFSTKPPTSATYYPNMDKKVEDLSKAAAGITPTPWRPDDETAPPLTQADQQPAPDSYQYPDVSPEDYWS